MDNAVPQLETRVQTAHLRVVEDEIGIVAAADERDARQPLRLPPPALFDVDLDQPDVVCVGRRFFDRAARPR